MDAPSATLIGHRSLPSADLPVSKIGTARLLIYLVLGIVKRVLLSGCRSNCLGNETRQWRTKVFCWRDLS